MAAWFPFALIVIVMGVLVFVSFYFIGKNKIGDPRVFIAIAITDLFILVTMCTFAIIIGWGAGQFKIDPAFMKWLGVATVGEVASMLGIVLAWYFKAPASSGVGTPSAPTGQTTQTSQTAQPTF